MPFSLLDAVLVSPVVAYVLYLAYRAVREVLARNEAERRERAVDATLREIARRSFALSDKQNLELYRLQCLSNARRQSATAPRHNTGAPNTNDSANDDDGIVTLEPGWTITPLLAASFLGSGEPSCDNSSPSSAADNGCSNACGDGSGPSAPDNTCTGSVE